MVAPHLLESWLLSGPPATLHSAWISRCGSALSLPHGLPLLEPAGVSGRLHDADSHYASDPLELLARSSNHLTELTPQTPESPADSVPDLVLSDLLTNPDR